MTSCSATKPLKLMAVMENSYYMFLDQFLQGIIIWALKKLKINIEKAPCKLFCTGQYPLIHSHLKIPLLKAPWTLTSFINSGYYIIYSIGKVYPTYCWLLLVFWPSDQKNCIQSPHPIPTFCRSTAHRTLQSVWVGQGRIFTILSGTRRGLLARTRGACWPA